MNGINDAKYEVILIDLDVLLDTRLASFAKLYPNRVNELLKAGYRDRRSDRFGELGLEGIDQSEYDKQYKLRDKSVLKLSRLTAFMSVLLKIIKQYEYEMVYQPDKVADVYIVINTAPYDLDNSECAYIVSILKEYLGNMIKIKIDNVPLNKCSVNFLKYKGVTQYITYDFYTWMEYHYASEDESQIQSYPELQIVAPALLHRGYSKQQLQEIKENGLEAEDPFELFRAFMAAHFGLTFLPVDSFSYLDPAKLET